MPSTKRFEQLRKAMSPERQAKNKNAKLITVLGIEIFDTERDWYAQELANFAPTLLPTENMVDRYTLFRLCEYSQETAYLLCSEQNERLLLAAVEEAQKGNLKPQTIEELWSELGDES